MHAPLSMLDWGAGQYEITASELEPVARRVIAMAEIASAERVLDVACGTGNAALLAARGGAKVTGLDASKRLLSVAAARAEAENLHAHWQTGDLHQLPFADGSFEVVTSVFGVIFAHDPLQAISEIVRVLVPGGRALLTTWIPSGGIDAAVGVAIRAVAAATGGAPPPRFAWSDRAAVSAVVAQAGAQVSFAEGRLPITGSSPEGYFDEVLSRHPIAVSTRGLLKQAGTYERVREEMIAALSAHNEDPSALLLTSRYLIARIRPQGTV